jgi:hypothetical protein
MKLTSKMKMKIGLAVEATNLIGSWFRENGGQWLVYEKRKRINPELLQTKSTPQENEWDYSPLGSRKGNS